MKKKSIVIPVLKRVNVGGNLTNILNEGYFGVLSVKPL